ncbi:MAG: Lrp/AsnC family transcriptional regulator [Lentisphaeria bacterium]|nr:Lrp/AsnC family transcriptional regulator [Lentisphaeria bacterium]
MENAEQRKAILRLLRKNARIPVAEIAARLELTPEEVEQTIAGMERDRLILGYLAIVNEDAADDREVRAIIEVEVQPRRESGFDDTAAALSRFPEVRSVYLVSGRYDLRLEVVGTSLQDVAHFVASRLASQEGVKATATHFLLKKYKEAGVLFHEEEEHERLKVVP